MIRDDADTHVYKKKRKKKIGTLNY